MRIRVNFTYVTSLLDGVDVMARHHHARQHARGRGVATHTGDASVGQETLFPASCSSRHCSKPIPALYHWHAGREVYSVSHARYTSAAQDHPVYIYKNNLSPIQFVLVQYLMYQMHSHYKNLKCNASYINAVVLGQ